MKKNYLLFLIILVSNLIVCASNSDSTKNTKLTFGFYFDELLSRQIILTPAEYTNSLNIVSRLNDTKGGREFYDIKGFHFTPLLIFKSCAYIHCLGFHYNLYNPPTTSYQAGEFSSNENFSSIGGFYRIEKIFSKKEKLKNQNHFYSSIGIKLDGTIGHTQGGYSSSSGTYTTSDYGNIASKNLTLALSPSLHLKMERSVVELGVNINLLSWVDYHATHSQYSKSGDPPWTPLIENEKIDNISVNELLTPIDFYKGKTIFFSVFMITGFNLFKK